MLHLKGLLFMGSLILTSKVLSAETAKEKAPSKPSSSQAKPKSQFGTSFSFEGAVIEGQRLSPASEIIQGQGADLHYDLVTLRENWRDRMRTSVSAPSVRKTEP